MNWNLTTIYSGVAEKGGCSPCKNNYGSGAKPLLKLSV